VPMVGPNIATVEVLRRKAQDLGRSMDEGVGLLL